MNKTALELLISEIETMQKDQRNPYVMSALNTLQLSAQALLPVEREQIINAHFAGHKKGYIVGGDHALGVNKKSASAVNEASLYFQQTYKGQ